MSRGIWRERRSSPTRSPVSTSPPASDSQRRTSGHAMTDASAATTEHARVLVVDDDPFVRLAVCEALATMEEFRVWFGDHKNANRPPWKKK